MATNYTKTSMLVKKTKQTQSKESIEETTRTLFGAAINGHIDCAKAALSKHPKIINCQTEWGESLLFIACIHNNIDFVEFLLEQPYLDPNLSTIYGATPFFAACDRGNTRIVELFRRESQVKFNLCLHYNDKQVIMDACGETYVIGESPLCIAVYNGHIDVVNVLLTIKDINLNHCDEEGDNALTIADREGHEGIAKVLRADPRINSDLALDSMRSHSFLHYMNSKVKVDKSPLKHKAEAVEREAAPAKKRARLG